MVMCAGGGASVNVVSAKNRSTPVRPQAAYSFASVLLSSMARMVYEYTLYSQYLWIVLGG